MKHISIPNELLKLNQIFSSNGFKAYLVGGAVRDSILGKKMHDWDIATNAHPNDVMRIFHKVIPTGISHGTVTVRIFGKSIEVTTFRTETEYSDGRHPDQVHFASTIEEDLSRRDFTMNAIALDLSTKKIVDPFNGVTDINNKIIRTVGSPLERFTEDGLRPVRAVRFAGQLGFEIERGTYESLSSPTVLEKTAAVSVERFRDEWCKMLQCPKPSVCLKLLEETGILKLFIPEFTNCRGCTQKDFRGFHEFDVADHIFYAVDGAPADNLIVRIAAFYHDIGKPEARRVEKKNDAQVIHFHGHEKISAQKCRASMSHLKFSNDEIKQVEHLVAEHMFNYESIWTDAAVRRFLIKVGQENVENLIALRLADIYGMHNTPLKENSPTWFLLAELKGRLQAVIDKQEALSIKDLAVNGSDLIKAGIPQGKKMGAVLKELFETVTDSPAMNTKEKLLTLALNLYREKFS